MLIHWYLICWHLDSLFAVASKSIKIKVSGDEDETDDVTVCSMLSDYSPSSHVDLHCPT